MEHDQKRSLLTHQPMDGRAPRVSASATFASAAGSQSIGLDRLRAVADDHKINYCPHCHGHHGPNRHSRHGHRPARHHRRPAGSAVVLSNMSRGDLIMSLVMTQAEKEARLEWFVQSQPPTVLLKLARTIMIESLTQELADLQVMLTMAITPDTPIISFRNMGANSARLTEAELYRENQRIADMEAAKPTPYGLEQCKPEPYVENGPPATCTVCQEDFIRGQTTMVLPCHHRFHEPCITPWFVTRDSCPTCRARLPRVPPSKSK